jgi:hypothetical protein
MAITSHGSSSVKTFPREQFEELATRFMKNFRDQLNLTDEQFDFAAKVVVETMTQSLLAQGYELPWVRKRRH